MECAAPDDGTHLHGVDLRIPGAPPIGIGYIQPPDGPLVELQTVTAREAFGDNGLPAATELTLKPGGRHRHRATIRGHAPVLLTAADGRVSQFPAGVGDRHHRRRPHAASAGWSGTATYGDVRFRPCALSSSRSSRLQAHRGGGGDVAAGDDRPGDRGERPEQLLDLVVVERRRAPQGQRVGGVLDVLLEFAAPASVSAPSRVEQAAPGQLSVILAATGRRRSRGCA